VQFLKKVIQEGLLFLVVKFLYFFGIFVGIEVEVIKSRGRIVLEEFIGGVE